MTSLNKNYHYRGVFMITNSIVSHSIKSFITFLSLSLFLASAHALPTHMTEEEFAKFAFNVSEKLSSQAYSQAPVDMNNFKANEKARFDEITDQEQSIWFDTILEGDYKLGADDLGIDQINKVYNENKLPVAYRVRFSQDAFDTASCDYDSEYVYQHPEETVAVLTKAGCTHGHIVGYTIISLNLQFHERDSEEIESFQE